MNQEEMLLKKKFIKNYNLPLSVLPDPVFQRHLIMLDTFYDGVLEKWQRFQNTVNFIGGMGKYLELHNTVYERAIESVQKSPGYDRFNREEIQIKHALDDQLQQLNISKHDIYRSQFLGHEFISLDMKKAGFSVLHAFDPAIFYGKNTYEEWLGQYTDQQVFLESKSLRQAILGNCNPKRQGRVESIWMKDFLARMLKVEPYILDFLVCINKDELIFDLELFGDNQRKYYKRFFYDFVSGIPEAEPQLRCESFVLKEAYFKDDEQQPHAVGYLKVFEDGRREMKAVNQVFVPFVVRTLELDRHNADVFYDRADTMFLNEYGIGYYESLRVGNKFVRV